MDSETDLIGPRWASTQRGYALSQCLQHLKRHRLASLATLLVLGITLTLPALLYFVNPTLQTLGKRSMEGETLTAYLSSTMDDQQGAELAQQWLGIKGIRKTSFLSSEDALSLLRDNTDLGAAIDALGANPLPGAIIVYPDNDTLAADLAGNLASGLSNMPEVDRVQFDLEWIKRLRAVVSLIQWVAGLMAAFLLLTALLVITNTIRLETARRRSEMQVANLLGASGSFIKRPILYTGVLFGLISGLIACAFALTALHAMQQPADDLSSLYNSAVLLEMPNLSRIFTVIGVSIALGLIGSVATAYRQGSQLTLPTHEMH